MATFGLIASFLMGIILGLMGGGGSILTVPILVYLFNITPTIATGYSLFVVGITALVGSFMYIRKGDFDFKVGMAFAIPSVIGVNLSRGLVIPFIPDTIFSFGFLELTKEILVMIVFAVLMIAASYSMIKRRKANPPSSKNEHWRIILVATQGFVVGLIAGFVGAGGGFLIIPALVLLAGLTMRVAIGTSLTIIALQSLIGFGGDILRGSIVDWKLLGLIAGTAMIGIVAGSRIAHKINEQKLKVSFGWFVLIIGATILLEQLRHISM
ncbi:sulfite exporter TauE/SafE family protein [Bdellovibrio sp. NC01]|uniref:sulfite exporter TauE/SafE family protein n=1 Tax=Bdellovibrio sp. NC01 TaxID=2220073 RepID=UPI00115C2564|nr:sulfite exporter TauE/SafE family protein [Bdellovibrio sp. NC01]QDK39353.1 sulfite exporter TauE/SafE family protein [Bdellovibrio sp. NC01]